MLTINILAPYFVILYSVFMWLDKLLLVISSLAGGGVLVTLFTLRSSRRAADAAARAAELSNIENSNSIILNSIVAPLRARIEDNEKEIARLRRDFCLLHTCAHAATCPVLRASQGNCPA